MSDPTPTQRLLSFSAIDVFDLCARKYYYERVLWTKQDDNLPFAVGDSYHLALAALLRSSETGIDQAVAAALSPNAERLTKLGCDVEALRDEMAENLDRISNTLLGPGKCEPMVVQGQVMVERRFKDPDVGYQGILDLVSTRTPLVNRDGVVVGFEDIPSVLDWKTSGGSRRRTERDARVSAQLGLYALVGMAERACFVEVPRDLGKPLNVRVASYCQEDLLKWKTYLQSTRASIGSLGDGIERYAMTSPKNALCSPAFCSHYFSCYPGPA